MIGVSVGLGNVWRFPYMMGKYGGSAFLIVYLFFTLLFAIPAVMAEWALARETRQGPIGAFSAVFGVAWGKIIGYMLLITVLVADSYYLVVVANVFYSAFFSFVKGFGDQNLEAFASGLGNGWLQYAIAIGILIASLYIIYRGLNRGIEAVSKFLVPFFGVVIIYLVINAFLLEGAPRQFAAFLKPDFSVMRSEHIFAALGQAFFSLGLGGTFLLIYGSYLKEDQNIPKLAVLTGLGDTGAALLASLFIIPSILVFGLDMTAGPGLIFSTLPKLFSVMPLGRFLGTIFMLALFFMAFLSNIAALEVLVGGLSDVRKTAWSRNKIILFIGILEFFLILPSCLNTDLIATLDLIFGSGMQVFGSALAVIGVTWGLGKSKTLKQIFSTVSFRWQNIYFFWLKWVIPTALLFILLSYIFSSVL